MAERCPACGERLSPDAVIEWGGYALDETSGELRSDREGEFARTTRSIADIVAALLRAQGRVCTKEQLWGATYAARPECDWPEPKIVDVYVCKMRRAAPWFYVETVWGRGYRLLPRDTAALPVVIRANRRRGGRPRVVRE